ncbi:hypothetical protein AXE65_08570 [Ventosimonas gracilis]|uniref:Type IV pilus modification protein PilV n=1 Tax=Ventosimonas gracilis TaxID=1680762 RepID=A0A139SXU5_9GAMM|nr:type IV pilus modification protein PilV [Ventosimonas gracilis]KXU39409.1 hypothetical protein AXE65_08570 [Ventosimonas gracilis]
MSIKYHQGFSMIEILVALVILAIGLLGMATLMINSLQTNQSAAMRSTATLAAYDLVERMRSNADEQVLETTIYSTGGVQGVEYLATGAPDNCNEKSAADLAVCDRQIWAKALNDVLPDAMAIVKFEGTVTTGGLTENRLWCIGIFWKDTGGQDVSDKDDKACGETATSTDKKPWAFYEVKVLL